MRISSIYTQSVGPLADGVIKLEDDWSNEIEAQVYLPVIMVVVNRLYYGA